MSEVSLKDGGDDLMGKLGRMRRMIEKKVRELGSNPDKVEWIKDRCSLCGGIVFLIVCEKGTLGLSENTCCMVTCDRIRRERGLPGFLPMN